MKFTFTFFTWVLLLVPMPLIVLYTFSTFVMQSWRRLRRRQA